MAETDTPDHQATTTHQTLETAGGPNALRGKTGSGQESRCRASAFSSESGPKVQLAEALSSTKAGYEAAGLGEIWRTMSVAQ